MPATQGWQLGSVLGRSSSQKLHVDVSWLRMFQRAKNGDGGADTGAIAIGVI
jgi:hypothetical protein